MINIHKLGLPISFENIIPNGDSARLLYDVTKELNYTKLNKSYSIKCRNSAVKPESLFKILVYGYGRELF